MTPLSGIDSLVTGSVSKLLFVELRWALASSRCFPEFNYTLTIMVTNTRTHFRERCLMTRLGAGQWLAGFLSPTCSVSSARRSWHEAQTLLTINHQECRYLESVSHLLLEMQTSELPGHMYILTYCCTGSSRTAKTSVSNCLWSGNELGHFPCAKSRVVT